MKRLNRKPAKFRSKTDHHTKKMFKNSGECISKFALKKNHKIEDYYEINQYHNWWEDYCCEGEGKLKQNLENEILSEIFEYNITIKEEEKDEYN